MREELAAIDVSAIEELQRIKKEQDVVLERLERMDEKRTSVSEEVFARVQADYKKRLEKLEREAEPLKEQARQQYARLTSVHGKIEAAVAAAMMDREELQLRHELGEFDDEAFAGRMKEQEARVAGHQGDLEEAESIRKRFLSAFHSEDELEAAAAPPPPPSRPKVEELPEAVGEVTVVGGQLTGDRDKTTAIPVPAETGAQRPEDGTMILKWPKLVVHSDSGEAESYSVVGAATTIGSAKECDMVLAGKKVAGRHAEIRLGPNGHIIKNLGAAVGTLVNGVEITERELADGDVIQIGGVKLTFTA